MFITIKSDTATLRSLVQYQKIVEDATGLKTLVIPKEVEVNIVDVENKANIKL